MNKRKYEVYLFTEFKDKVAIFESLQDALIFVEGAFLRYDCEDELEYSIKRIDWVEEE